MNSLFGFLMAVSICTGQANASPRSRHEETAPPTRLILSDSFLRRHPGVYALLSGDNKKLLLYSSDELYIAPLSPQEMTESELTEILCAAKFNLCLKRPDRVAARFYLRLLPAPAILRGIEFYHTPASEMEKLKQGRVVGYFHIRRNPDLAPVMTQATSSELVADLRAEWKGLPSAFPQIETRSILQDTLGLKLVSGFKNENLTEPCEVNGPADFVCEIRFDLSPGDNPSPGWSEQWLNDLIRKAQVESLSLGLILTPELQQTVQGNLVQTVPLMNINLTAVTAKHFGLL